MTLKNEKAQVVLNDLLDELQKTFFDTLEPIYSELDSNTLSRLAFTVLLHFNTAIIYSTVKTFGLEMYRKDLMKELFEKIRSEVNRQCKLETMQ